MMGNPKSEYGRVNQKQVESGSTPEEENKFITTILQEVIFSECKRQIETRWHLSRHN